MKEIAMQCNRVALWTKSFCFVCITNLMLSLGFQLLMPTLPLYVKQLGGGERAVGLIVGVFSVTAILVRPFVGRLLDEGNRRVVYTVGLVIVVLAMFGYSWAITLWMLVIFRLLHGVGFGFANTSAGTIASDLIPRQRLTEGMGYYGLTNTLAMALAPLIGFYLIERFSFSILFRISTTFAFAALIMSFFINCPQFEIAQQTEDYKYLERTAFLPSAVVLFATMPFGALVSFIALYAIESGIANIGFFFTTYALALAFSRPMSGMLADKYGFEIVVVPGLIMAGMATLLLGFGGGPLRFAMAAFVFGLGLGSILPSMQALAIKRVPPNRRGAAVSTLFSSFDVGIGLGSLLWGVVVSYLGFSMMYYLATIPSVIALLVFLAHRNIGRSISKRR